VRRGGRVEGRREKGHGGEVAQTMCTHMNKYKNNKNKDNGRQKSHVFFCMWKINPKYKCTHKFK
jgi:hypothetical protein